MTLPCVYSAAMSKIASTLNSMKKPTSKDWHRADIIAAVRKTGTTLQQLAFAHSYTSGGTLRNALNYPAPKYERIIAEFLGTTPQKIWPSRYHIDGSPKSGRGERGIGRYQRKTTGPTKVGRKPKAKFNGSTEPDNVNFNGSN